MVDGKTSLYILTIRISFSPSGTLNPAANRVVAVMIAFVGYPRIVLLDEPTKGLEKTMREVLWKAIGLFLTTGKLEARFGFFGQTSSSVELCSCPFGIRTISGGLLRTRSFGYDSLPLPVTIVFTTDRFEDCQHLSFTKVAIVGKRRLMMLLKTDELFATVPRGYVIVIRMIAQRGEGED